jgi:hypothetical protein
MDTNLQRLAGLSVRETRMPPETKRWIVWLCAGCEDCEPAGVEDKSGMPCRNSPSMNGGVVVLAEEYDALSARLAEAEKIIAECDSDDGFCGEMPWDLRGRIEQFISPGDQDA